MSAHDWKRDAEWERAMFQTGVPMEGEWLGEAPKAYRKGSLFALVSRDEIVPGDARWHISIRHNSRLPEWQEVAAVAHDLRPGVCFVIGIPPKSWWINVHERVLHLFEFKDDPLIAQWAFGGRGDQPT